MPPSEGPLIVSPQYLRLKLPKVCAVPKPHKTTLASLPSPDFHHKRKPPVASSLGRVSSSDGWRGVCPALSDPKHPRSASPRSRSLSDPLAGPPNKRRLLPEDLSSLPLSTFVSSVSSHGSFITTDAPFDLVRLERKLSWSSNCLRATRFLSQALVAIDRLVFPRLNFFFLGSGVAGFLFCRERRIHGDGRRWSGLLDGLFFLNVWRCTHSLWKGVGPHFFFFFFFLGEPIV